MWHRVRGRKAVYFDYLKLDAVYGPLVWELTAKNVWNKKLKDIIERTNQPFFTKGGN